MFGDKAREKERSVHSGNTSDDFTTHSDLPKDESRTESVNGETNALQLCESFKQAGRDFAAELDGYHIFKVSLKFSVFLVVLEARTSSRDKDADYISWD